MVILIMEVFYTRLFSVLFWHHTAFAVLSLALLGIGAAGLFVYLKPQWFARERVKKMTAWLIAVFALSLPVFTIALTNLPLGQLGMYLHTVSLFSFVPAISLALVPFFLGGLVVSTILMAFSENISRLYFWDLCGAALGAVSALALLRLCNGPFMVVVLALILSIAGAGYAFANTYQRLGALNVLVALLMLAFFPEHGLRDSLNIVYAKGVKEPHGLLERWDPVARIRVLMNEKKATIFQIDSGVITPILRFRGDFNEVDYLKRNILQLAYNMGPYKKCLIIGPGGGSDVLSALTFGNKDITVVEINRSIVSAMQNELASYNGGLYNLPEIDVNIGEGRGFLAHMAGKVDLIQATFIDTFAAASSGSHTLSENYLYTTDAINDYLDHLTPEGVISISRFGGFSLGYSETYRVIAIAERTLRQRGVTDPQNHIVAVQGPIVDMAMVGGYQLLGGTPDMATILISKAPFSDERLKQLDHAIKANWFRPLWVPKGINTEPTINALFSTAGSRDFYESYYKRAGLDISPIDDDRPFFFDMLKPVDFFAMIDRFPWQTEDRYFIKYVGVYIIYQVFFALALLTAALIAIPLLLRGADLRPLARTKYYLTYFTCLGVGFMGVELGLIQRFSLFLGHPVYSLVVILASLLMFSGLGSLWSNRITARTAATACRVTLLLCGVLAVYGLALPPLLKSLIGFPFAAKALIATLIVLPPGFLMGMLFPLGVKSIPTDATRLIPWMWGVNSGFSVLASILSLYMSMSWGFTFAWYCFTAAYLLASFCIGRVSRATLMVSS